MVGQGRRLKGTIGSWSVEYDRSEEMTGAGLVTEPPSMEKARHFRGKASADAGKRGDVFEAEPLYQDVWKTGRSRCRLLG